MYQNKSIGSHHLHDAMMKHSYSDTHQVSAVIVTYDSAAILPECMAALHAQDIPIIIVDNASTDHTVHVARDHGAALVLQNTQNEGYGRANNKGITAAQTRYVFILNPDVVLQEGAITALMEAANHYPSGGLYAPCLIEPDGRFFWQSKSLLATKLTNPHGQLSLPGGDSCAPFLSGAAFLVERSFFLKLGGFDEKIFLFYEDDDLCRRMMDCARPPIHVHQATAMHQRGKSASPKAGRIYKVRWHQAWSRSYVCRKYHVQNDVFWVFIRNLLKSIIALITFRHHRLERYTGSMAGAFAALRKRSAFAHEGLKPTHFHVDS